MKKSVPAESASALIDGKIQELGDWRGKTLARVRELLHEADPEIVEEWKWGTAVWSHDGIVCTGETYKKAVKMTFAKGARLKDPSGLFNSSLEGNVRRAICHSPGDANVPSRRPSLAARDSSPAGRAGHQGSRDGGHGPARPVHRRHRFR